MIQAKVHPSLAVHTNVAYTELIDDLHDVYYNALTIHSTLYIPPYDIQLIASTWSLQIETESLITGKYTRYKISEISHNVQAHLLWS